MTTFSSFKEQLKSSRTHSKLTVDIEHAKGKRSVADLQFLILLQPPIHMAVAQETAVFPAKSGTVFPASCVQLIGKENRMVLILFYSGTSHCRTFHISADPTNSQN
jgi:hypothetical protein